MKAGKELLRFSPSKTLSRFAEQIASCGKGPVLDAPCGYGRNALALAARGCTVIGVDIDRRRLAAVNAVKKDYIAEHSPNEVRTGKVLSVCADLTADGWPIAPSSISAIICVHFAMIDLIPRFLFSLHAGGCLYIETFGGQGQNYRDLPRAQQLRQLLSRHVQFEYYKERRVGPPESDRVTVTLFAKRPLRVIA